MIPGALSTVIMPILVKHMGVGEGAQVAWLTVMSLLSLIAIPAAIIEYYFTIERVTKETEGAQTVSFKNQVRACFHDKYWVAIMAFVIIMFLCSGLTTNSMLYYCNWVLASSVSDGASKQILVNIIGQSGLVKGFFSLCFAGIPLAGYIISVVIILVFGGLEKTAPEEAA